MPRSMMRPNAEPTERTADLQKAMKMLSVRRPAGFSLLRGFLLGAVFLELRAAGRPHSGRSERQPRPYQIRIS